ncbi:hypothetical protein LJ207_06545 [Halanaerobium sp. Z-7514]|uniref:Response regulator receiver and SARP domain protein n=1 Tax=Halanaerobium polyolivorans TaxID=2886943 RepID=A0AAW4WYY0_9FIRM|nr:hypothetical protein [Halanaerobium polyolivorans]MCC3144977.1 hypothetical protein [Halanaerobium polyolivorans]
MKSLFYGKNQKNNVLTSNLAVENKSLEILELFHSKEKLFDYLRENEGEVDILFLEIDNNEDYIFSLVEQLLDLYPKLNFIFISSKDHDFIEILEKKELFYLSKPFSEQQCSSVIEEIKIENEKSDSLIELYVETMGEIEVYDIDRNKLELNWPDLKTKELFAFLLHNQGQYLSRAEIIEELWAREKSEVLFQATLLKLRKIFNQYGFDNLIEAKADSYRIDLKKIEVDFIKIEELLKKEIKNKYRVYQLLNLYQDSYLAADDFDWCKKYRKEFEKRIKKALIQAADYFMAVGQNTITKNVLTTLIDLNCKDESVYNKLINIYKREGNRQKADELLAELEDHIDEEMYLII